MKNFAMGYYRFCLWATKIVYLHALWILFSIIGLVIFGVMPATAAMFAIVRKWMQGKSDVPIFSTFKESFRKEFKQANIIGYILLIVGYILYLDLQFVRLQASLPFQFLNYMVLLLFFLYFIVLLFVFPTFVHFKLTIKQYLKWPLALGVMHPVITIITVIGLLIVYYVTLQWIPALFAIFGLVPSAFVMTFGAKLIFDKLEEKASEAKTKEA